MQFMSRISTASVSAHLAQRQCRVVGVPNEVDGAQAVRQDVEDAEGDQFAVQSVQLVILAKWLLVAPACFTLLGYK
jgi:hypothetical protein